MCANDYYTVLDCSLSTVGERTIPSKADLSNICFNATDACTLKQSSNLKFFLEPFICIFRKDKYSKGNKDCS